MGHLTDAHGRPLHFILTGAAAHDPTTAADFLAGQVADRVIADKAYHSNDFVRDD